MRKQNLAHYLKLRYPFRVQVDEQDGYFVTFPDLPGCMTGAERIEDLPGMIEEVRSLWIETTHEIGQTIPEPTLMAEEDYSGKFNVRLPRTLHRELADTAEQSGVSLNQLVVTLLSAGDALARVERRIDEVERALHAAPKDATRVAEGRAEYRAVPRPRAGKRTTRRRTT